MNVDIITLLFLFLAFCVDVIMGAAFFYDLNRIGIHISIEAGYAPDAFHSNISFFNTLSLFIFGLTSLLLAISEILLFFIKEKLQFISSKILRGGIMIFIGIACLGVANDLGIAGGSMGIIVGAALVVYGIIKPE